MRRKRIDTKYTQHALLVAWGEYGQEIGVPARLEQVPLQQQTREHTPQCKVKELLVATLGGLPYLQDISRSSHPLDQDQAVARAWGERGWADYSGVSRMLQGLTLEESQAVIACLQALSQPFIDQEVVLAMERERRVVLDGDLTGIPVSKSSHTYPETAFGFMDDEIRLGYQAAVVSLRSATYGRLWLSIEHKPGNTLSCTQAEGLVQAAEASLGRRPRRRTELLTERLAQLSQTGNAFHQQMVQKQARLETARACLQETERTLRDLESMLSELVQAYQGKEACPKSKLALTRQRQRVYQQRLLRNELALGKAEARLVWAQERQAAHDQQVRQLEERLVRFQQDNAQNECPLEAVFRLDGGFGTWDNLALLIEMGYEVYTKAFNHETIQVLFRQFTTPEGWKQVGAGVEMLGCAARKPHHFCYPIDIGLMRFTTTEGQLKKGAMLHFGLDPIALNVRHWFEFYNGRQSIEAGIKESKHVFYLHRLKVRSLSAILLQEHCVLFAANFIRWANVWLMQRASGSAKPKIDQSRVGLKHLVQVAAHTSANVIWFSDGCLLRFSDLSLLAGKELFLPSDSLQLHNASRSPCFFHNFRRFAK
jgi:hypothetical protein